jgi:hypothetical protein
MHICSLPHRGIVPGEKQRAQLTFHLCEVYFTCQCDIPRSYRRSPGNTTPEYDTLVIPEVLGGHGAEEALLGCSQLCPRTSIPQRRTMTWRQP